MSSQHQPSEREHGMSLLALNPFPAFTPWNWGALTPGNVNAAAIEAARLQLTAWRSVFDASRAILRAQQDRLLDSLQSQAAAAHDGAEHAPDAPWTEHTAFMLAGVRGMSEMTRGMLAAQREAMSALAPAPVHAEPKKTPRRAARTTPNSAPPR